MQYRAWLNALLAALVLLPILGHAECSRAIRVPMSETGLSVIADGSSIASGVYPDILRSIQTRGECIFAMSIVPRARLEAMFKNGSADLLIPATRSPQRDVNGIFVPLIRNRAMLVSVKSERAPVTSIRELVDNPSMKLVLVRGYSYGAVYDDLAAKLDAQGRLQYESDPISIARRLIAENDLASIMAPSIIIGALRSDGRYERLLGSLRFETLEEFPWGDSGAYISRSSLSEADKQVLMEQLEKAVKTGLVWKEFRRYYGEDLPSEGVRPR